MANQQAVDLELCELIFGAERHGDGMPVTLYFNGMIVSGNLTGSRIFYERTGDTLGNSSTSESVTEEMLTKARDQYYEWGQQALGASGRREEDLKEYLSSLEDDTRPDWQRVGELAPVFIHLSDVRIKGAGPSDIIISKTVFTRHDGEVLVPSVPLRIRFDSVVAWHAGILGEPVAQNG